MSTITQMKTKEAARILEDELFLIEKDIKKITSLDNAIFDDYFNKYNAKNEESHFGIIFDFEKMGSFLEIVYDNIYDIRKILKNIGTTEE